MAGGGELTEENEILVNQGNKTAAQEKLHAENKRDSPDKKSYIASISSPDFFLESNRQQRYLHFFQNNSNILHLVDFNQIALKGASKCEFTQVQIKNPGFKTRAGHKSIITPQGALYLIGGYFQQEMRSNELQQYDFSK